MIEPGGRRHWRGATAHVAALTALLAVVASTAPAAGYVPRTLAFEDGAPVLARWGAGRFPVELEVSRGLTSDLPGSDEIAALESAISTWNGVEGSRAALSLLGEADVSAGVLDGINAVEFSDDPRLDRSGFISLTRMLTRRSGRIREADILINDRRVGFNTEGETTGLDLETVMLHEFGHFLGLDHSPLGSVEPDQTLSEDTAVMFPVPRGPGQIARSLTVDDEAAVVDLYPDGSARFGAIEGSVTRGGGPIFGAHVLVFDPLSQVLVGGLTLPDGSFRVGGLPPGRYVLRALPLDDPAGPDSFGGIFERGPLDTGFQATFLPRPVDVEAGSTTDGIGLEVQ